MNKNEQGGSIVKMTVVVCTHNPRREFLERTLEGLRRQTFSVENWDLLVVDNASTVPASSQFELTWHPRGRILCESILGLTAARLAAIAATTSELLVFVDDDNVLDPDYLQQAHQIAQDFPQLGCMGGQALPDFIDGPPAPWVKDFWPYLALRVFDRDYWTNLPENRWQFIPNGAGMVVRRAVANSYAQLSKACPLRGGLGRRGQTLISGEDTDLALLACDLGFGIGCFNLLRLTHIMPAGRLTEVYLMRLVEGSTCSYKLLRSLREPVQPEIPQTVVQRLRRVMRYLLGRGGEQQFQVRLAKERGLARADQILSNLRNNLRDPVAIHGPSASQPQEVGARS